MKRRIWAILMMTLIMLKVINIPVSAKDLGIYHSDPDMIIVYDGKNNFETDKNLMLYDFSDTKESGIGREKIIKDNFVLIKIKYKA